MAFSANKIKDKIQVCEFVNRRNISFPAQSELTPAFGAVVVGY